MYFFEREEEKMIEQITVTCNENDCSGVFVVNRYRDDFSPRVHNNCSECGRFMSVKLHHIEQSRIINREWL